VNSSTNLLLAHPGTQHSVRLAREFVRHDVLSSFHTCLTIHDRSPLAGVLSAAAKLVGRQKEFQNRILSGIPKEKVHSYPLLELKAQLKIRRGNSSLNVLRERNQRFQERIPQQDLAEAEIIVGFDTSSHVLAARAKSSGKKFILDRSIGFTSNALFESLQEQFPEWAHTWESKSEEEFEIESLEHELADRIVVPSQFVADTLAGIGVRPETISVNPFGADLEHFQVRTREQEDKLIFLFVGALQARKGLPLLLRAWQKLNPTSAELWIAGPGAVPATVLTGSPQSVKWLGPIAKSSLPSLFQRASVFVFPSYFEGLALVQIEAAACGLPIIGTTASGAAEIVTDGETGYLIKPGDLDMLMEKIETFITSPQLTASMAKEAASRRDRLAWSKYGDRWRAILGSVN
jgi:hypothetical protein